MSRILQAHKDAIYDWMYSIYPAMTIIWDDQDEAKPTDNYILLGIITSGNLDASADKLYPDDAGLIKDKITYRTYKNLTLSVNVFSQADYFQIADAIVDSQFYDDIRLTLKISGLVIRKSMPVTDLTAIEETNYTKRCSVDFMLAYTIDRTITASRLSRIRGEVDGAEFDVTQP